MYEVVVLEDDDEKEVAVTNTKTSINSICTKFLRRNSLLMKIEGLGNKKLLPVYLNFDNQSFPEVDSSNCIDIAYLSSSTSTTTDSSSSASSKTPDILDLLRICIEENFNLISTNVSKERLEPVISCKDGINSFEIYPNPIIPSTSYQKSMYPVLIDNQKVERIAEFYLDVYYSYTVVP